MATNLKIYNQKALDSEFLGNNAVYMGYCTQPDDYGRAYTDELCEKEFQLVKRSGIKLARTFYNYNFCWDEQKGCFDFESPRMKGFYKWLGKMQEMDIEVIISIGWWLPYDVVGGSGRFAPASVPGDKAKSIENYAKWGSDSLYNIIVKHGFTNVKYITLFTEPQCDNGGYDTIEDRYEGWLECVKALDKQLKKDGLRDKVKFMAPNEGSTITSEMLKWVAENADEYIDVYSSHTYMHIEMPELDVEFSHNRALLMSIMGGRVHQKVKFNKNSEYKMTVKMMLRCNDPLRVSGHVLMGAFYEPEGYDRHSFTAGGQETTRLHRYSTHMIDAVQIDDQLKEYSFTFSSLDNDEGLIGLFYDVKQEGAVLYVDSISLRDENGNELLVDSEFETNLNWYYLSCDFCCSHAYYDWEMWAKTGMAYVPNNKPYIFDEYNEFELGLDNPVHGTAMSLAKAAFMNSGAASSLLWTLFDQQWPSQRNTGNGFYDGVLKHGVVPVLTEDNNPYPSFEAFAITTRFFGGKGTLVYRGEGKGNLQCTAASLTDGNFSVMVVNYNAKANDFELAFDKPVDLKLNRFLYDPKTAVGGTPITADKTIEVGDKISDTLPEFSVAVYTTFSE